MSELTADERQFLNDLIARYRELEKPGVLFPSMKRRALVRRMEKAAPKLFAPLLFEYIDMLERLTAQESKP